MSALSTLFTKVIAQTGPTPALIEVARASGIYIYDADGKAYADLNSGYCVSALGHCHPEVVAAVQKQSGIYMHTSVYGEHVQSPQVRLAERLITCVGVGLESVFFVNSGAEAVEGAMKLAKRVTGRQRIISCQNGYHGSTQGADSLRSDIPYTSAFMPLLPGVGHIRFGEIADLEMITQDTAAVIMEPVQAEAGVRLPPSGYLAAVRKRCDATGTLLVFDEIQTGMGRTGSFCAFQAAAVVPDILLLAKALGAGMPLGAFLAKRNMLQSFVHDPMLGHLTTFGGHPVSCAAALAGLEVLLREKYMDRVPVIQAQFIEELKHPLIREIRCAGLLMAVELKEEHLVEAFCMQARSRGLMTDMFLFDPCSFRIAPPLVISDDEVSTVCQTIAEVLDAIGNPEA